MEFMQHSIATFDLKVFDLFVIAGLFFYFYAPVRDALASVFGLSMHVYCHTLGKYPIVEPVTSAYSDLYLAARKEEQGYIRPDFAPVLLEDFVRAFQSIMFRSIFSVVIVCITSYAGP